MMLGVKRSLAMPEPLGLGFVALLLLTPDDFRLFLFLVAFGVSLAFVLGIIDVFFGVQS